MPVRESPLGRLTAHFLRGFLHNDLLLSPQSGIETTLAPAAGLIVTPGLFYCLLLCFKYAAVSRGREALAWEDRLLFVTAAMILTGLLTVVEWDSLFPDRRDYHVLISLPITARLLFLAKFSAVLLLLVLFWGACNLGPAVLFPCVSLAPSDPWFVAVLHFAAHAAATFAASAFVFLFLMGLQGLLLNLLPVKWFQRVSVYVQMALVVLLVLSFFLTPLLLMRSLGWIRGTSPWTQALPPFWFLGLYQVLIGEGGPLFSSLAVRAAALLGAAGAAAGLAYAFSYRRHLRRSLETLDPGHRSGPSSLSRRMEALLDGLVLRHPLERACFHFVRKTLLHSRIHRLLLAAYLGVGFAFVLAAAIALVFHAGSLQPRPALLSIQMVLSFFVLSGMRFVFTVPAELRANWAFHAVDPPAKSRCGAGMSKAMFLLGVCPVLGALLPLHGFLWGWPVAAAHLVYGAALSWLLTQVLLQGFEKIPFTCSYLPGKANLKALWPVYLMAFWVYGYALAVLEFALLTDPVRFALACAGAATAAGLLGWYRRRRFGPGFQFLFEDLGEPAVRTLDIGY